MDQLNEAAILARRQDVIAEISELGEQLVLATAREQAAEVPYAVEKSRWDKLNATAASGLHSDESMAAGLHSWLHHDAREPLKKAEGERGAARAQAKSLKERIALRRGEVDQIDRALEAGKVVELRPNAAPARRKAPIEEYDNIQPGRAV